MKKVFFVLLAFATLSFTACSSGGNKTETMDDTTKQSMQNEAQNAVQDTSMNMPMDTSKMDTSKKM